jgi:hypothetical protein
VAHNVNRENERIFKALVKQGVYRVCKNGNVYRGATKVGYTSNTGYVVTAIRAKGRVCHIQLHRLVYLIHAGPIAKGLVINHKDGNKRNNKLSNLEAVSDSQNSLHAMRTGLFNVANISGCKNVNSNLTKFDVREIRKLYASGCVTNKTELSRMFNVSKTSIRQIITRTSYKNV